MFAYKLKDNDSNDMRFVEGVCLNKKEYYCVEIENKKLSKNILVDNYYFKGYQIPQDLLDLLVIKENLAKTVKAKSANKIDKEENEVNAELEKVKEIINE